MNNHYLSNKAHQWLSTLPEITHHFWVSQLKTDASLRTYLRIHCDQEKTFVFCQTEPHEQLHVVFQIHHAFQEAQVSIPRLFHAHPPYLLYEDLGNIHLKTFLAHSPQKLQSVKQACLDQLMSIQSIPATPYSEWPCYKDIVINKEFVDLFRLCQDAPILPKLVPAINQWTQLLEKLPQVVVHRDFHWENIMMAGDDLRLIDYHEAMIGPPTYDLASLIADRGFFLKHQDICDGFIQDFCSSDHGGSSASKPEHIWLSIALRCLKIIGNFDRLTRTVRSNYRSYFFDAIQTLNVIPWEKKLPKQWSPNTLLRVGVFLRSRFPTPSDGRA